MVTGGVEVVMHSGVGKETGAVKVGTADIVVCQPIVETDRLTGDDL